MAEWKDLGLTYKQALHGMQSAVLMKIILELPKWSEDPDVNATTASPKHLRVGVNSAMVEHSALVNLLFKKKIITDVEFMEELRLAMNNELAIYEAELGLSFR